MTEQDKDGDLVENDHDAYAEFISADGWEDILLDNFTIMAISYAIEIKIATDLKEDNLIVHIINLKTKAENVFAVADSEKPMSLLSKKNAGRLQINDKSIRFRFIPPKMRQETWRVIMKKK